jgi:hypothetical protein
MKNQNQANGNARKQQHVEPVQNADGLLHGIRVMPSATLAFLKKYRLRGHELLLVVLTQAQARALWDARTESTDDRKRFSALIGDKTLISIYRQIWRAKLRAELSLALTEEGESYIRIFATAVGAAKRITSPLRRIPVRGQTVA